MDWSDNIVLYIWLVSILVGCRTFSRSIPLPIEIWLYWVHRTWTGTSLEFFPCTASSLINSRTCESFSIKINLKKRIRKITKNKMHKDNRHGIYRSNGSGQHTLNEFVGRIKALQQGISSSRCLHVHHAHTIMILDSLRRRTSHMIDMLQNDTCLCTFFMSVCRLLM